MNLRETTLVCTELLTQHVRKVISNEQQEQVAAYITNLLEVQKITREILRQRAISTPERVFAVHRGMDAFITAWFSDERPKPLCHGCTTGSCCRYQVDISESEAFFLASVVEEGYVQIDRERLEKQAAVPDDKEDDDRISAWLALPFQDRTCVFLTANNRCGVYEMRPMVCRKWFIPATENRDDCAKPDHHGAIQLVPEAEAIAAVGLAEEKSGRLPTMLLAALKKKGI